MNPPSPNLSTDAGKLGVWIVALTAGVFLIPHFMAFTGATIHNYQRYRLVKSNNIGAGAWTPKPYTENKWVLLEALFVFVIGMITLATLKHYGELK